RSLGLSNLDLAERARSAGDPGARDAVNAASERVFAFVRRQTGEILDAGRLPGVIGGEHAVAEGCIVEAAARHPGLGVLQIDAHMDLRASYEGFDRSHASVMHNVLRSEAVGSLVQVGMRDCCVEETRAARSDERVRVFFADDLADRGFRGESFASVASEIVSALPDDVWISFDIDGLEPSLCPGTGTPVPGGLSFAQASHLLHRLAVSGRRVVGFDLTEVAPSETGSDRDSIDAIVGARVLYRLCGAALLARERLTAPAG
ncbi:MAG: arginase family protein, partial [Planctomycetota bacterium]